MKKLNNHGFGAIEVTAIVIVVAILGFVGYRAYQVYSENGSADSVDKLEKNSATIKGSGIKFNDIDTSDWTEKSVMFGDRGSTISYKYPQDWQAIEPSHSAGHPNVATLKNKSGTGVDFTISAEDEKSLDSFITTAINNFDSSKSAPKTGFSEPIKINGHEALVQSRSVNGKDILALAIALGKDINYSESSSYAFLTSIKPLDDSGDSKENANTLMAIAKTIKISK